MTAIQQLLEWIGMGLVGLIAVAVILMLIALFKETDDYDD
jgi:hypothetical protein